MTKMSEAKFESASLNKANILGVKVAVTQWEEVIKIISSKRSFSRPFFVVTVNPEFIMQAQEDEEFRLILNAADLAIPDGNGLKLAIKELEVIPGRKIVQELVGNKAYKIFYLGGRNRAAKEMAEKYGGEWDEGEKSIRAGEYESERILAKINTYKPDILLVAYGAPWQEKWIYNNLDKLQSKVVMGVGGTFDALTGRLKLPPRWMEKAGLEWLWRLIQEPKRWKRQLKLVKFVALILWARWLRA